MQAVPRAEREIDPLDEALILGLRREEVEAELGGRLIDEPLILLRDATEKVGTGNVDAQAETQSAGVRSGIHVQLVLALVRHRSPGHGAHQRPDRERTAAPTNPQ